MGEGGGKGLGTTWPNTVKQSGAGGTLTPADRHGSVQVSLPAHLSMSSHIILYVINFLEPSFFLAFFCIFSFFIQTLRSLSSAGET